MSFSSGFLSAQNNKVLISSPQYLAEPVGISGTTLVMTREGKLVFIYRKGDWDHGGFSSMVYYKQSIDEGRSWTSEKELVNTPGNVAQSFATISPVSGEILLFYIDRGKGMVSARSENQ